MVVKPNSDVLVDKLAAKILAARQSGGSEAEEEEIMGNWATRP